MRRHLFRLNPICRWFASLATSDPFSMSAGHASSRLHIVQIDHYDRENGTMRLYNLLDGMPTASMVNLGNLNHTGFRFERGSLNPLKGLSGYFLSAETLERSKRRGIDKRRMLVFDPITNKTLSFHKPYPRKSIIRTNRIAEPLYIGRCFQQSPSLAHATMIFKVIELYDIKGDYGYREAIGCDICTICAGSNNKRLEWRSLVAAVDLPLTHIVSLDDYFYGANFMCWGVCRDGKDSRSMRQLLYVDIYHGVDGDSKPPIRVGSPLDSILSLDLVTETVNITPFPPSLLQRPNSCNMHLCNLDGHPSICLLPKDSNRAGNLEVWMLKGSDNFNAELFGDPNSWFLRCSISAEQLPCGYLGPLALWQDKLFLIHEWAEDRHIQSGCSRLVYYDLCSKELLRVVLDDGDEVNMDSRSDISVYDESLAPIWPGVERRGRML